MSQPLEVLRLKECRLLLASVEYKIAHLQNYYSSHQIRVWKTTRKDLRYKIKVYTHMLNAYKEGKAGNILRGNKGL